MPRRDDLKKILIIGSGPIVIGQACEFDYSGTQACKALREEGYQVVLVNSNPATIMTDPATADRTYIEPLTWEIVAKVIEKERPDALLPTLGGQTGLNLAMDLARQGGRASNLPSPSGRGAGVRDECSQVSSQRSSIVHRVPGSLRSDRLQRNHLLAGHLVAEEARRRRADGA